MRWIAANVVIDTDLAANIVHGKVNLQLRKINGGAADQSVGGEGVSFEKTADDDAG